MLIPHEMILVTTRRLLEVISTTCIPNYLNAIRLLLKHVTLILLPRSGNVSPFLRDLFLHYSTTYLPFAIAFR